ncbi:MAG: hypothetical protein ACYDBT_00410 [Desulfobulbaceae bacterium]
MTDFKKDERVKHLVFGFGTVLGYSADGQVDVDFSIKNMIHHTVRPESLERVEAGNEEFDQEEWLRATFCQEEEEARHFMGSHWGPFFDKGAEEFVARLPEYLREAQVVNAFANLLPPPRPLAPSWPEGFYLAWPHQQAGMQMALTINSGAKHLISLFPVNLRGFYHHITIRRVIVWESGLVAQIEAELGDALITFFDIHFISNRAWYVKGGLYQFVLTGIAYVCQPAENKPMVIDPPPQWLQDVRREKKFEPFSEEDPEKQMVIRLDKMAVLLPIEDWDRDDYSFHGPIKNVIVVEILGQEAWLLTTTVMRSVDDNADVDLDILVTRRAWQGDKPPQVGTDIEGQLWLQGHLSWPGESEEE